MMSKQFSQIILYGHWDTPGYKGGLEVVFGSNTYNTQPCGSCNGSKSFYNQCSALSFFRQLIEPIRDQLGATEPIREQSNVVIGPFNLIWFNSIKFISLLNLRFIRIFPDKTLINSLLLFLLFLLFNSDFKILSMEERQSVRQSAVEWTS